MAYPSQEESATLAIQAFSAYFEVFRSLIDKKEDPLKVLLHFEKADMFATVVDYIFCLQYKTMRDFHETYNCEPMEFYVSNFCNSNIDAAHIITWAFSKAS